MKFMALGGAEKIGASCYYLEICGKKLILDCGKGLYNGKVYGPDYSNLINEKEICNLNDIDVILISHGHFDHIGALKEFANECKNAKIYTTPLTKQLADIFMIDKCDPYRKLNEDIEIDNVLHKIQTISYNKCFFIDDIKVTFYEAGHILGACMMYFETSEGNVLYTGDFLKEPTKLTNGYILPKNLDVDILIMCATHGKHINHKSRNNNDFMVEKISKIGYQNIFIKVSQLTKGLETLMFLKEEFPEKTIYLDEFLMKMCDKMHAMGLNILSQNCKPFKYVNPYEQSAIYIGCKNPCDFYSVDSIQSLHARYSDCVELVQKLNPEVVFVVHSEQDRDGYGEYALHREFNNKTIVNTKKGHLYKGE